jgi:polar amino acid transport system substrate-binding protein
MSWDHRLTRRTLAGFTAAVCALALLAGCTTAQRPATGTPAAAAARPLNVLDPAPVPSAAAAPAPACDPRASLRPPGSLPQPGAMPAGSTMAKIAQRGRLIVGADQNAYFLGYRDPATGQLAGFDIDIARELARAIFGNPDAIQFRTINAADRIPAIQNGSVDVVVRSFTITCDRLQQVAFSTEYLTSAQRVLVTRGSGYHGMADLGGKKVCASRGSTNIPVIQQAPSHPVAVAADSVSDCMVLLQQGQIDAVSTDESILIGLAAQDPNVEIVGGSLGDTPVGIAMAKNSTDLVRFVNGVLDRMRADGTWTAIYRRWLGVLGSVPAPPTARYSD